MPICIAIDGTQTITPHIRGARRYVSKLIEALINSKKGIDLKIFCNTFPRKIENGILADSQMYPTCFSGLPGRCLDKWWKHFSFPSIDFFIGSHDIFHAPTIHLIPPTKGKLVCTVHDLVPLIFPNQCSEEYLSFFTRKLNLIRDRADAVIADSESTKNDLVNLMDFKPEQVFVIPLAPSLPLLPPHFSSSAELTFEEHRITKPYLLYVGGPEPHKNLSTLIEVFKALKLKSYIPHKLVMAGENIAPVIYQDFPVLTVELGKDIVFTGYLSDEQLSDVYANADAFIFLSLYEGFGLAPLDAMQFGVPVVASRTSSIPEVVGTDAILVDPLNIEEIKQAIKLLLEDRRLRETLGKKGKIRAAGYSWESTASQTIAVYEKLIGI